MAVDNLLILGAVASAVVGAVWDLRCRRIPNWLTLPAALIGVALNLAAAGQTGLLKSALGMLTGVGLLVVFYLLGGMGAGDVKMLGAVGAFLGPKMTLIVFVWMALAGGLLAIILILWKKAIGQTFQNMKVLVLGWVLQTHDKEANITISNQSLIKLPYGVPIAIGTILAVVFKRIPSWSF